MDRISALSKQVGATFGDIVWAVNPQHDTVQGLIDQTRKYAGRMLVDSGITADLTFAHVGPDRMLDPATKRDIFLVLKEALNNVLKHAKATHVIVSLKTVEDQFRAAHPGRWYRIQPPNGWRKGMDRKACASAVRASVCSMCELPPRARAAKY